MLSVMVGILVGVFAIYIYFCRKARRPVVRAVSLGLMTFGLLLGVPKFIWRVTSPGMSPPRGCSTSNNFCDR